MKRVSLGGTVSLGFKSIGLYIGPACAWKRWTCPTLVVGLTFEKLVSKLLYLMLGLLPGCDCGTAPLEI